jgi:hypothetical protein
MSQLTNIPKQSYFSAQLETGIDASQTTDIILTAVPDYTPGGETIRFNILDSGGVETISATGWTGTELTGVTRGVDTYDGESAVGLPHGGGITVVLSDDWTYFEDIQTAVNSKFDTTGGVITGPTSFSGASTTFRIPNLTEVERDAIVSPANGMLVYNTTSGTFQFYDGGVWDDVGTATVPNASETVAGIVELSTAVQSGAATSTGETGARLVMANSLNVTTSAGAGDAGKNPVLNASGFLDPTILNAQTTSTVDAVVRGNTGGKIDPSWQYGTSIAVTAGENLTVANAVFISTGLEYNVQNQLIINSTVTLDDSNDRQGQTITLDKATKRVRKIDFYTAKTGSPSAASLTLQVFAVSSNVPTGSAIASVTVADASITNGGYTEFQFASDVELIGDTQYAFVLSATNVDGSNNYQVSRSTSDTYTTGRRVSSTNGGSTWSSSATEDLVFRFYEKTGEDGKAYKTTADTLLLEAVNGFVGFVFDTTIAADTSGFVIIEGLSPGFTGLSSNSTYYLSDTFGQIATTAGTVGLRVGKTQNATTEILVKLAKPFVLSTGQNSSSAEVVVYTGFRPSFVRMRAFTDSGLGSLAILSSNGVYYVDNNEYATIGVSGDGTSVDGIVVTNKIIHLRVDDSPAESWFVYIINITNISLTIDIDYDATVLPINWVIEIE